MTPEELKIWWSYWTSEHFASDERESNGKLSDSPNNLVKEGIT